MTGDAGMRLRPEPERRKVLLGALGALAGLGGVIAGPSAGPSAYRALAAARGLQTRTRAGLGLGTTVSLTLAGPETETLERALSDGFRALRAVESEASLFRADSALTRLNRDGVLPRPGPHLLTMLRFALQLAEATDGAFDPTVQPLWTLWAGMTARGARPSADDLRAAVARVDWRGVVVEESAIRLARPGMGLTLNSLVQGYAADCVMAAVTAHGITDAFLDTGEFGARGHHADGTPWRLGIADPRAPARVAQTLAPFTGFAATSGDYAMSFSPDHADHHIFDPKTGTSPRELASATVTAPTGLLADGLSTAAFVLDASARTSLLARYPGCRLYTVAKSA